MSYRTPLIVRAILCDRFPAAFCAKGKPKKPLKIGIRHDLVALCPDLKKGEIGRALQDYTRGPTYLRAMTAGAFRVDLEGQPAGAVTAAEAETAAKMLEPILAGMAARRAQAEPARDAAE